MHSFILYTCRYVRFWQLYIYITKLDVTETRHEGFNFFDFPHIFFVPIYAYSLSHLALFSYPRNYLLPFLFFFGTAEC